MRRYWTSLIPSRLSAFFLKRSTRLAAEQNPDCEFRPLRSGSGTGVHSDSIRCSDPQEIGQNLWPTHRNEFTGSRSIASRRPGSAAVAYHVFNRFQMSARNSGSLSQVQVTLMFAFAVTANLLVQGLKTAVIIGLIGDFLPALRATRLLLAHAPGEF